MRDRAAVAGLGRLCQDWAGLVWWVCFARARGELKHEGAKARRGLVGSFCRRRARWQVVAGLGGWPRWVRFALARGVAAIGMVWHGLARFGTSRWVCFAPGIWGLPSPPPSPRRVELCAQKGRWWRGRAREGAGWFDIGLRATSGVFGVEMGKNLGFCRKSICAPDGREAFTGTRCSSPRFAEHPARLRWFEPRTLDH